MSVLRALSVLGLVCAVSGFWGGSAHAQTFCESEAVRLAFEHPKVWKQAGNPTVECGSAMPGGPEQAGWYDRKNNVIHVLDGQYIAHELGHAWQMNRKGSDRVREYAHIRGFASPYSVEAMEDYAETFAFVLGEWDVQVEHTTPAPYGFQTSAGVPTDAQIDALRDAGLLPTHRAPRLASLWSR